MTGSNVALRVASDQPMLRGDYLLLLSSGGLDRESGRCKGGIRSFKFQATSNNLPLNCTPFSMRDTRRGPLVSRRLVEFGDWNLSGDCTSEFGARAI
jgi:hypothetical protein